MSVHRAVITLSHSSLGGTGTNTWHIRSTSTGLDSVEADIVMGRIRTFYESCEAAFASGTVVAFDGQYTRVDPPEGDLMTGDEWTRTFDLGTDPLPPACALCVSWRGSTGGRSGRGRTFLGPISADVLQDNGTPTEAALGTVRDAAAALASGNLPPGDGAAAIWSRQDELARDIVASSVRNQFASLRSRRD